MTKRKGHSPAKRLDRLAAATMKNTGIIYIGGNNGMCQVADLNRSAIYKPGMATAKTLAEARFYWSVFCAVFCRDQTGKEYMKSLLVNSNEKLKQSALAPTVTDIHTELVQTANSEHVVNVGWIACPDGRELTESEAGRIFESANAWDFAAKWEAA